jgi:transcriptional regulator with XRE-family HTH domain
MNSKDIMSRSKFSQNIIKYRKAKGLSQDKLAELTGISKRMIAYYETHISNPPINNVIKIAEAIGVSLYDLIDGPSGTSNFSDLFKDIDMRTLKKIMLISKLPKKDRITIYNMIDALIEKTHKTNKETNKDDD